jgi:hypothetical protein
MGQLIRVEEQGLGLDGLILAVIHSFTVYGFTVEGFGQREHSLAQGLEVGAATTVIQLYGIL